MAYDEMELDMLGDQRTAMFVIISDTDDTFNFVVSILYTQLFNLLCDKADDEHGGRLPYHVRLLLDEFANIGQIPKFDKLIATIRSREISASIILQSQSQLKTIRVSTDQCLMAGKMILHKFKSQGLCFLASKMVFVFIARIKTDDIVMGLDFVVSVVFSILVIEHFALKIKGVGIAVYSIHVKFAAEHHAPVFIKERF